MSLLAVKGLHKHTLGKIRLLVSIYYDKRQQIKKRCDCFRYDRIVNVLDSGTDNNIAVFMSNRYIQNHNLKHFGQSEN